MYGKATPSLARRGKFGCPRARATNKAQPVFQVPRYRGCWGIGTKQTRLHKAVGGCIEIELRACAASLIQTPQLSKPTPSPRELARTTFPVSDKNSSNDTHAEGFFHPPMHVRI
jgi:hypothetical protein